MVLKVVLALAVVALAAAQGGYDYQSPSTSFSHGAPVRAATESSEEDDGYKYRTPVRVFKHRVVKPKKAYVAPVVESSEEDGYNYDQPATNFFTHRAPVRVVTPVSSEEDGYNYDKPSTTFTHRAPVRVATPKPKNTYVAPVRVAAPVVESSEEDGYNYKQPATTFTHRAPVRVAAPKPKKTYVAPVRVVAPKSSEEDGYDYQQPAKTFSHRAPVRAAAPKPQNTYVAPAKPKNTYEAPRNTYKESEEVLDYVPSKAEYKKAYEVSDDETGADFHHEEERDGAQTRGSYSVALPDGRTQTVTYYVDGEKGFVAEVTYEGEAEYPPEPEGGYGPWTGATAGPPISHVSRQYSAPAPPAESSEEDGYNYG